VTLETKNSELQSLLMYKTRALEQIRSHPQPAGTGLQDAHDDALRERVASLEMELQTRVQELDEKSKMVANATQQLMALSQCPEKSAKRDLLHVGFQTLLFCGIWMILIWKLRRFVHRWRTSRREKSLGSKASSTINTKKSDETQAATGLGDDSNGTEQSKTHDNAQLETKTRLAVGGLVLQALRPRSGVMPAKGARAIMLCDVCDAIYFHLVNPKKIARTTVPMLVADAYSNSANGLALASKVQLLEHQTIKQDKNVSAFVHVQTVDMNNQLEADSLVHAVQSVADMGVIAVHVGGMDQTQLKIHLRAMLCHLKMFTTTNMPRPFQVSAMQKELGLCGSSSTRDSSDGATKDHLKNSTEAAYDRRDTMINHGQGEVATQQRGDAFTMGDDKDSKFLDADMEDAQTPSIKPRPDGVPPIQMSKLKEYVEQTMATMESKKEAVLKATIPPARAVVNP